MEEAISVAARPPRAALRWAEWRVVLLSSFGGALEFYDFVVYSMFAQYIGATFFPARDPLVSLILSFAVFSVGYLARPVGGVVLSHFGDRHGRRPVFIVTILVMSGSTVCMGLLPGYASWGIAASVLMVLLRLLQGFCLGGELPGAITYVTETSPRHAGFVAGMIFFCVNSGVGLASLLSLIIHETLTPDQVAAWGWRLGFLAGGVFGLLSFWLRLSLEETREFTQTAHIPAKRPFVELMRTHPARVIVGIGVLAATGGFNGLLFAMPALLPGIMHYTAREAIVAQNVLLAVLSCGLLFVAWAGDHIPRRYFLGFGALLAVLFAHGWFAAADARTIPLPLLGVGAALVASFFSGSFAAIAADLFPTRVRFSGIAVVLNVSFSLFSGVAPLVATALVKATGSAASAGWYMAGCASLTLIASLFVHRYDGMVKQMMAKEERA